MGKRDDMKAALERRQPPGAVPVWELQFHLWDEVSGRHVVLGQEFEKLTPAEQDRALHANAEIMLSVCDQLGAAALTVPDDFWYVAPGQLAYFVLPGDAPRRQRQILRKLAPPDLMLVDHGSGVINLAGSVDLCYQVYDAPEQVEDLAKRALAEGIESAKRLRDEGAEAVKCAADIADSRGPCLRREHLDRFVFPYLRDWAAGMRNLGLYSILHTDGMLDPILDELADSGLDALQAIDPVAGMDVGTTKQQVGDRLCLCGNVDCGLLQFGPPSRIYETVRNTVLAGKPGGCFVLGASNAVFKEIPLEHYQAMLDAWRDVGRY